MAGLDSSRVFGGLSGAELRTLEESAQTTSFSAGQEIIHEGDPGTGVYIITDGKVAITSTVGNENCKVLSQLGPGDFFGEMAVLDDQGRSATVTAETEVRALFIPRDQLLATLSRSPKLAISLMKEVSQRMRDFNLQYTREVIQAERLALVGRFARSIVHDFKNPLNIVGISADMAAMENATVEMRQLSRDRIRRQINRMSNMISELLEFTRGRSQQVVMARLSYGDFVRQFIAECEPELEVKSVKIELENEPPDVGILLDPTRLSHVFNNLFNNACDAMEGGGTILLRFREEDDQIITEIQDTGSGIATEVRDRLFEAFATYGKAKGTGLGLSICQRIVEDHQGTLTARNGPEGGALFTLTLPLRQAERTAALNPSLVHG